MPPTPDNQTTNTNNQHRKMDRRTFLRVAGLAITGIVITACRSTPTAAPDPTSTTEPTKVPATPIPEATATPTATETPTATATPEPTPFGEGMNGKLIEGGATPDTEAEMLNTALEQANARLAFSKDIESVLIIRHNRQFLEIFPDLQLEIIDRITGESINAAEGVRIFFDAAGNPILTVTHREMIEPRTGQEVNAEAMYDPTNLESRELVLAYSGTYREPGGEQVNGIWIVLRTENGNWPDPSQFEPEFVPVSENKEYPSNSEAFEAMINPEPLFESEETRLRILKTDRWDEVKDEAGNGLPGIKLANDYPVEQLDVMLDKLKARFIETGAGDGTHKVLSLEKGELVDFDFVSWREDVNVVLDVAKENDSVYVHLPNGVEMRGNFIIGEDETIYAVYLNERNELYFYVRYPYKRMMPAIEGDFYSVNYRIFSVLGSGNASNDTTETYFSNINLRAAEDYVAPLADGLKDIFLEDFAYYKDANDEGSIPFLGDK
jgi:hypothetical protein